LLLVGKEHFYIFGYLKVTLKGIQMQQIQERAGDLFSNQKQTRKCQKVPP